MLTRRTLLAAAFAPPAKRLLIDTHLEVWTFDKRFPFDHPQPLGLERA